MCRVCVGLFLTVFCVVCAFCAFVVQPRAAPSLQATFAEGDVHCHAGVFPNLLCSLVFILLFWLGMVFVVDTILYWTDVNF